MFNRLCSKQENWMGGITLGALSDPVQRESTVDRGVGMGERGTQRGERGELLSTSVGAQLN